MPLSGPAFERHSMELEGTGRGQLLDLYPLWCGHTRGLHKEIVICASWVALAGDCCG